MNATASLLALLYAAAAPLAAQSQPDSAVIRRALRLHREVPMIDGHNDLPWKVRAYGRDEFDSTDISRARFSFDSMDIARPQPQLMTDIPRLRAGAVGAQFWSTWVPVNLIPNGSARTELEQIDIVHRMVERYPETFELARTADDIVRIHRRGRVGAVIGMEGGHVIENSLPLLRMFYDLGARYLTLAHSSTLAWVDAATDSARHNGLTPFGREVVREMNRLGMLVDISHVSDSVMMQVLRISEAPVIFSHSSARAIADVPRNVPDEVLRLLPGNGGVVMVNFFCSFVDPARVRYGRDAREAAQRLRAQYGTDSAGFGTALRAWRAANPQPPPPPISVIVDHIDHVRRVASIDNIGLGSDFDGISCAPRGLEDVGMFPNLTAELLRRGYSDDDVKKIIGLNVLRAMRQAEQVAARVQRQRGPSTATIAQLDSSRTR